MSSQAITPYIRAARFANERAAGAAYFRIQKLIDSPDAELSAYRLQLRGVWHVAVVGDAPDDGLAEDLEKTLASGEPADLPGEVLDFIWSRREEGLVKQWVDFAELKLG